MVVPLICHCLSDTCWAHRINPQIRINPQPPPVELLFIEKRFGNLAVAEGVEGNCLGWLLISVDFPF